MTWIYKVLDQLEKRKEVLIEKVLTFYMVYITHIVFMCFYTIFSFYLTNSSDIYSMRDILH